MVGPAVPVEVRFNINLVQVALWWAALRMLCRAGVSLQRPTSGWRTRAASLCSPLKVWATQPSLAPHTHELCAWLSAAPGGTLLAVLP